MTDQQPKVSKSILKTSARYLARLQSGERMMRDANGKIQWASGKAVGGRTIAYMMDNNLIQPLDTDLFGNPHRGQTLGVA